MATALITGASSGIGRDLAILLSRRGYNLILVGRSLPRLEKVLPKLSHKRVQLLALDLSKEEHCYQLYRQCRGQVDLLINNAGFGLFGEFASTKLDTELNLLDLNVRAVHILTKLFLRDMVKQNRGSILNVASVAACLPGPLMAAYYASKAYLLRLDLAIWKELKKRRIRVQISTLCPGPVDTGFNRRAGVQFAIPGRNSFWVAAYALEQLEKGKRVILPGWEAKAVAVLGKIAPDSLLLEGAWRMQRRKEK